MDRKIKKLKWEIKKAEDSPKSFWYHIQSYLTGMTQLDFNVSYMKAIIMNLEKFGDWISGEDADAEFVDLSYEQYYELRNYL